MIFVIYAANVVNLNLQTTAHLMPMRTAAPGVYTTVDCPYRAVFGICPAGMAWAGPKTGEANDRIARTSSGPVVVDKKPKRHLWMARLQYEVP